MVNTGSFICKACSQHTVDRTLGKHQEGKTEGGIVLDEVTRNCGINKSRRC